MVAYRLTMFVVLCVSVVAGASALAAAAGQRGDLYVATNGNDAWSGELAEPNADATDGQIDRLVYELYGLTEEEIRIVEGAVAG